MKRFGIYFTPAEESSLARAAEQWLGRDIWSPACITTPYLPGISEERTRELLRPPRHYGFHATLKPPFRVAINTKEEQIMQRLTRFADNRKSFTLPPLQLQLMSDFFCLRPASDCRELFLLAAEIVQHFDDLRLPPTKDEFMRRRAAGLSSNQEMMLQAWGYPYVMNEFRFHLTLTGKTTEQEERDKLTLALSDFFPAELRQSVELDTLALFVEEDSSPMYCLATFPLQR